ENVKDEVAFQALAHALALGGDDKTVELLTANHLKTRGIGATLVAAGKAGMPNGVTFLRAAIEKSSGDIKSQAELGLGWAQAVQSEHTDDSAKAAELSKEAEELLLKSKKSLAASTNQAIKALAKQANEPLAQIRLAIGHVAPDIAGVDTDGKKFKLSD